MKDRLQKLLAAATEKRNDELNNLLIDVGLTASEYASLAPLRKGSKYETIAKRLNAKSKFLKALIDMRDFSKGHEAFEDVASLAEEMRKEIVAVKKKREG